MSTFTKRGKDVFAARDASNASRSVVNADAVTWSTEIEQSLELAGLSDIPSGTLANRATYDAEVAGFLYIQTDHADGYWRLHRKASATSGDWDTTPQVLWTAGTNGINGARGGSIPLTYDDNVNMADPGADTFRLQNSTPELSTAIAVQANPSISAVFGSTSTVEALVEIVAGANRLTFNATGLTDNTTWYQITVQDGSITGTLTDGDDCQIVFIRNGDTGNVGDGFTGGSYDGGTGVVTFTSDDGLGFATGDLRGSDGQAFDHSGAGVPSNTLGANGETYLDIANGDTYIKSGGAWSVEGTILTVIIEREFSSRALAEAATISAGVNQITVFETYTVNIDGFDEIKTQELRYYRDANGTAISTQGPVTWSPLGDAYLRHWGIAADGMDGSIANASPTDDTDAVQKAFTWCNLTQTPLHHDYGWCYLRQRIEVLSPNAQSKIYGKFIGEGSTLCGFILDGDSTPDAGKIHGGLWFQKDGGKGEVTLDEFSIYLKSNSGNCGIGIGISLVQGGSGQDNSVKIGTDVFIRSLDLNATRASVGGSNDIATPAHCSYGYWIKGARRPIIRKGIYQGPKQVAFSGATTAQKDQIRYGDDAASYLTTAAFYFQDCYEAAAHDCEAHQAADGIIFAKSGEVEGFEAKSLVAVNCKWAVRKIRTASATTEAQPGGTISIQHANVRDGVVYVEYAKRFKVVGGEDRFAIYFQNTEFATVGEASPKAFHFVQCGEVEVVGADFDSIAENANMRAFYLESVHSSADATKPYLKVTDCHLGGVTGTAIRSDVDDSVNAFPVIVTGDVVFDAAVTNQIDVAGDIYQAPLTQYDYEKPYAPTFTSSTNLDATPISLETPRYSVRRKQMIATALIRCNATTAGAETRFNVTLPSGFTYLSATGSLGGTGGGAGIDRGVCKLNTVGPSVDFQYIAGGTGNNSISISIIAMIE